MKILIVEDNIQRLSWFINEFADCEIIIAKDAETGKKYVIAEKCDVIFLDHDLEFFKNDPKGLGFCPSDYFNTGYQVAKLIPDSINKKALIIIHSMNPVGASNIKTLLPQAHRMVFGTFKRSMFIDKK